MTNRELKALLINAVRNKVANFSESLDLPTGVSFEYRNDVPGGCVVVIKTPTGPIYYNIKVVEMSSTPG